MVTENKEQSSDVEKSASLLAGPGAKIPLFFIDYQSHLALRLVTSLLTNPDGFLDAVRLCKLGTLSV